MLNNLKNKKFVIFGSNGWIGKALIDFLLQKNVSKNNITAISSSVKEIKLENGLNIGCVSFDEALKIATNQNEVIFFHLAFILRNKVAEMSLEEYQKINLQIRQYATHLIDHFKPEKIVYSSSGAVYDQNGNLEENLDKNPYGYLKYEDEQYFTKIAKNIGSAIIVPRIFNIAGPYINKPEVYAIANFILQALENKKINISAKNEVIRSYVHIFDLIEILLSWCLDNKEDYFVFDSKNYDNIELQELAKIVFEIMNIEPNIQREFDLSSPKNIYIGDDKNFNILIHRYNIKLKSHKDCTKSVYQYLKNQ